MIFSVSVIKLTSFWICDETVTFVQLPAHIFNTKGKKSIRLVTVWSFLIISAAWPELMCTFSSEDNQIFKGHKFLSGEEKKSSEER